MNVKEAIAKIEKRLEKAQETSEKYQKKGQEMEYLAVECEADQKSRHETWRIEAKRDCYYQKYAAAIDYAEELEELMNVLQNKDSDEKVLFVNEERFENEFALYGESSEEWSNTISSIIKCDLDKGKVVLVICLKKLF